MSKTILFISPNYPPLNSSASISNAFYCRELSRLGYNVTVLTALIPENHHSYRCSDRWDDPEISVKRSEIGLYKRMYAKKSQGPHTPSRNKGVKSLAKEFLKKYLIVPDVFIFWAFKSYPVAKDIIEAIKPDIIITASEPNSVHLLGYMLKKKFGKIKWLTIYGDPWSLEPTINRYQKFLYTHLEKHIIGHIDRYVFTADNTRDMYCTIFTIDKDKTSVFSRGYDPDIYDIESRISFDKTKINFAYIGAINRHRNAQPLLDALGEIDQTLGTSLNFYFVGSYLDELKTKLKELRFVQLPGFVTFEESVMYAKNADFLLILDNLDGIQLPAKAFEYLGTRTPVMTIITNEETPLSKLMKDANRGPIVPNEKSAIKPSIIDLVQKHAAGQIPEAWRTCCTKYEISNVVKKFAQENIG